MPDRPYETRPGPYQNKPPYRDPNISVLPPSTGGLQETPLGAALGSIGETIWDTIVPSSVEEFALELAPVGKAVSTAVNLLPPKYVEPAVKALKQRVLGRADTPYKDVLERNIDENSWDVAQLGDISAMTPADIARESDVVGGFYQHHTGGMTPDEAAWLRKNKGYRSELDDMISGGPPPQILPEVKFRADLRTHPLFIKGGPESTPEMVIPHEFRHAGQDRADLLDPSIDFAKQHRLPYILEPHELDARQSALKEFRRQEGQPYDYGIDFADDMNKALEWDPKMRGKLIRSLRSPLIQKRLEEHRSQLFYDPFKGFSTTPTFLGVPIKSIR